MRAHLSLRSVLPASLVLLGLALVPAQASPDKVAGDWHGLRAGVAVVDATWHVGASAGQYASTGDPTGEWDPNVQSVKNASSYGVASRLTVRAIVLQSPGKPPVALVKDDNYLSQDMLIRRAAQLLADRGSAVTYDNLLVSATHDHNSPYYSTPAAGVWLFQDVMDLRMFEYQARAIADAVQTAERGMRPASLGATTVDYPWFHGNIAGNGRNENDGSPVGYPLLENDHGLSVIRIDDMSEPKHPKPLATYVNYAQHGESLDGYDLISADWLAPFERFVDRATGVPTVFSQGAVGSSEGPYDGGRYGPTTPTVSDHGEPVPAVWAHTGYAQAERGTHLLADKVIAAWQAIGATNTADGHGKGNGKNKGKGHDDGDEYGDTDAASAVLAPMSSDVPVAMLTRLVPGPVSHPYPSVSNCRTDQTVNGNPGAPVLGLPDCQRAGDSGPIPSPPLYDSLRQTGLPIPANYDATSFGSVEENLRIKLQVVRLGDVVLASCACEPQSDLIKALETRLDTVAGNQWNGLDYGDAAEVAAAYPLAATPVAPCTRNADSTYSCPNPGSPITGLPRITISESSFRHMRAEVNNPADGWDDPSYAPYANSEPTTLADIKGNFTRAELKPSCGYAVTMGLGHTSDYNGYTVTYREYMSRDAYRKALTSYGPHTADYMVKRLVQMAGNLRCGTPIDGDALDPAAAADEARQAAEAKALGQISSYYYDTWTAQIPDTAPVRAVTQPQSISRFNAATFTWVGGDNWTDNPNVTVQRQVDGVWREYGDMSGEVQTKLTPPSDAATTVAQQRTTPQEWQWTANFEAFDSYPRADVAGGQVPNGTYRFVVNGKAHTAGAVHAYTVTSAPFTVSSWTGIKVRDLRRDADGTVSFVVDPIRYPATYSGVFGFLGADNDRSHTVCHTCSFRPWATTGTVASAQVHTASGVVTATLGSDGRWHAPVTASDAVSIQPGDVRDTYGETNGTALSL